MKESDLNVTEEQRGRWSERERVNKPIIALSGGSFSLFSSSDCSLSNFRQLLKSNQAKEGRKVKSLIVGAFITASSSFKMSEESKHNSLLFILFICSGTLLKAVENPPHTQNGDLQPCQRGTLLPVAKLAKEDNCGFGCVC